MQGGGELAAGVGVAPCVGVGEYGGDCHAEFTMVGVAPGLPDARTCRLSVPGAGDADVRSHGRSAVMSAQAARRAGDRGADRGEDVEMLVETGNRQGVGYRWRGRGQAQESVQQPGAAAGGYQDGKAAGVRVTYRGQVEDEPAGGGTEHGK